ncbi:F-box only protein 6 isoform X1 [Misgurnus anguillicaudatus]|uniref:F-box only protein 6 isoform X1 n=2 Tax=Misgurnus anguillicaudatus TaxID=75329 RepID=UPI003CCFAAC6
MFKYAHLQPSVPVAVVEEILLNLPEEEVVLKCRLVCREWKMLVDSQSHWRARCRREGIEPCDASRPPANWQRFYFLRKKQRNLLKNPKAEEELNGWEIVHNGGDGWAAHGNRNPLFENTVTKCFVTSYMLCLKQQIIDLKKEGYSPAIMDQWQPNIKISDWYTPRCDCGCYYKIFVRLLGQNKEELRTFHEKVVFPQWNDEQWCHMTHVFKNYGPGVRFIQFIHGGKDTQFWKGWYGIRLTNSSVEICPEDGS